MSRKSSQVGPEEPLAYDEVIYNPLSLWDQHTYNVPEDGVYFFHMSSGIESNTASAKELKGLPYPGWNGLIRLSVAHDTVDTHSGDFLASMTPGDQVYVSLEAGSSVFSDGQRQTSLAGFNLNETMSDVVAFSASTTGFFGMVNRPIPFDNVLLDTTGSYSTDSHQFVAPQAGIYYFSSTIMVQTDGGPSQGNVRAQFVVNGQTVSELWRESLSHNDIDTLSKAVMLDLQAGDTVEMALRSGVVAFTPEYPYLSTFNGFLYAPQWVVPNVPNAWCVQTNQRQEATDTALDPVRFQVVTLNGNSLFDPETNIITIAVSGLYYIRMSAGISGTESPLPGADTALDMRLVSDAGELGISLHRGRNYNGLRDTLSRGVLLDLRAGTQLRVVLQPHTSIYSDGDLQTTFVGFLLA